MAMLAEKKRKVKWALNPRGKLWSEDTSKFGQKILEKMGWTSGKGLGADESGITEHIKVSFKNDSQGIGYKDRGDQWTQHEDQFNTLLSSLNGDVKQENSEESSNSCTGFGFKQNSEEETKPIPSVVKELSGESLEEKSKKSKARVHYKKFTRGKDISKYSEKDLANIFGKKVKDEPIEEIPQVPVMNYGIVKTESETDIKQEKDANFGITTIESKLSMADYFKSKMPNLGKSRKYTVGSDGVLKSIEKDERDEENNFRASFKQNHEAYDNENEQENDFRASFQQNNTNYDNDVKSDSEQENSYRASFKQNCSNNDNFNMENTKNSDLNNVDILDEQPQEIVGEIPKKKKKSSKKNKVSEELNETNEIHENIENDVSEVLNQDFENSSKKNKKKSKKDKEMIEESNRVLNLESVDNYISQELNVSTKTKKRKNKSKIPDESKDIVINEDIIENNKSDETSETNLDISKIKKSKKSKKANISTDVLQINNDGNLDQIIVENNSIEQISETNSELLKKKKSKIADDLIIDNDTNLDLSTKTIESNITNIESGITNESNVSLTKKSKKKRKLDIVEDSGNDITETQIVNEDITNSEPKLKKRKKDKNPTQDAENTEIVQKTENVTDDVTKTQLVNGDDIINSEPKLKKRKKNKNGTENEQNSENTKDVNNIADEDVNKNQMNESSDKTEQITESNETSKKNKRRKQKKLAAKNLSKPIDSIETKNSVNKNESETNKAKNNPDKIKRKNKRENYRNNRRGGVRSERFNRINGKCTKKGKAKKNSIKGKILKDLCRKDGSDKILEQNAFSGSNFLNLSGYGKISSGS